MDDLIYRSAAIDAMTAENLWWNLDSVQDDDLKRAARAAQRALARLPAAQPQQTCEYWDSESKFCALCRPSSQPSDEYNRGCVMVAKHSERRYGKMAETDLISRQTAIEAIQNAYCDTECGKDWCAVWKNKGMYEALLVIQDLPSAQQWIPVTDGLPVEDDDYYCYLSVYGHPKARYRAVCHYDAEDGFCEDGTYTNRVTHWMPLPEPPEEDSNEV